MHIELVFNNSQQKDFPSFLCLGKRKYIMFWYRDFLAKWEKLQHEK